MPVADELAMKARVAEILSRHAAVGLAVGVVRNGSLEFFDAHGVADLASNTPVTEDTVFRIASITKTFTAVAVMQLREQGRIDLDAPASDYLRAYRLIPARASFRPATVRDLLTHTAGVPQMPHPARALMTLFAGSALTEGGESYDLGQPLPTLAGYYGGGLRLAAEPGTRFTYGDHGFATLGQIVEDVSGKPLDRYFREHIFEPLGMADSDLLRSERVKARLATGYKLRSRGVTAVTDRQWVTPGASSIYSTPRDMARYVAALPAAAPTSTAECSSRRRWPPCSSPTTRPTPGCRASGWRSCASYFGAHLVSSTRASFPASTPRSGWLPATGLG